MQFFVDRSIALPIPRWVLKRVGRKHNKQNGKRAANRNQASARSGENDKNCRKSRSRKGATITCDFLRLNRQSAMTIMVDVLIVHSCEVLRMSLVEVLF